MPARAGSLPSSPHHGTLDCTLCTGAHSSAKQRIFRVATSTQSFNWAPLDGHYSGSQLLLIPVVVFSSLLAMVWWTAAVFTVLIHGELALSDEPVWRPIFRVFWAAVSRFSVAAGPWFRGPLSCGGSFVLCCQGFLSRWSWRWAWGRHALALPFIFPRLLSRYYPAPGL